MSHRVLLLAVLLGLVAQGSCVKKRLFFGDYSSSESSESSNSTESDEWLDSLLSVLGPFSSTTKRPAVTGTKIPITTTTSRPPIIKCSDKPTEPCPTDCLTDSAIIHGFCCNCKHPSDPKVKPAYLCPASTACPLNTTKLCDLFSRLMTCCCKDAFTQRPPTTPPSKPVQTPPVKPLPTPPMIPSPTSEKPSSTDPWPTPPPKPSPTSQKPSSTDPWPTPPPKPSPTSPTTPMPTSQKPSEGNPLPSPTTVSVPTTSKPSEGSQLSTTPVPTSQKPISDPSSTPATSSSASPGPLPTPPTVPPKSPSGDSPSSGKSQQHHIVVDIDSGSVHDEVVDLSFETVVRRAPRKRRHFSSFRSGDLDLLP